MRAHTANREAPTESPTHPVPGVPRSSTREYAAVLILSSAVFFFLCLASYDPRDPSFNVDTVRPALNLCGLVGSHIADTLVQLAGISAFVLPLALLFMGVRALMPMRRGLSWSGMLAILVIISCVSVLMERFGAGPFVNFTAGHPGGALGGFLHASFFKFLGSAGEIVLSLTILAICVLHLAQVPVRSVVNCSRRAALTSGDLMQRGWERIKASWSTFLESREHAPAAQSARANLEAESTGTGVARRIRPLNAGPRESANPAPESIDTLAWEPMPLPSRVSRTPMVLPEEDPLLDDFDDEEDDLPEIAPVPVATNARRKEVKPPEQPPKVTAPAPVTEHEMEKAIDEYLLQKTVSKSQPPAVPSPDRSPKAPEESQRPIKVTKRADEEIAPAHVSVPHVAGMDDYLFPPLDLLDTPPRAGRSVDERTLEGNAMALEQKLADLGIKGEVVEIHPGPVITMYELVLAPGIPLRKVMNTSDDLAMALKSGSTRVVAPIPGKDTVGIEVPNLDREIVYFREIMESPAFMDSKAPLKVALGKAIDGEPFATSLASMPHLLIAGATGTGKSVGLNCLICSWLMSCHPDDVKFIMVDPKKLELSYYQDIPHLIYPVVTEAEKVPKVLGWAIREMERRYTLLSNAGARNIEGYNKKVRNGEAALQPDGEPAQKLPYLVIIVDELAELMMVAAKDIEISIARLAQMARASGIHLILATQRPSVDVITGVIKANFPARLSFQVSAKPDSRTILDTVGAENLLGMGDMLFLPPGTSKMRRLHGAFVSEKETKAIVDYIKAQRAPVYLKEIEKHVSEGEPKAGGADAIGDEKYDEAVELVSRLGHASISLIQRHMRIGYNRAARIIEAMESEGLIGPSDGTSRPREVLARSLDSIPGGPF